MIRLAVVISHPIQYYSPWFQDLAADPDLQLKVFYLWDPTLSCNYDHGFELRINWDIPLLANYEYTFVDNLANLPGSHHFFGLNNPGLAGKLLGWRPDCIVLFGYAYLSHLRLIFDPRLWHIPLLLRGDSHLLAPKHGLRSVLFKLIRRAIFLRFAGGLPVGLANEEWMLQNGFKRRHLFFAPHAVDNTRFQAAASEAVCASLTLRNQLGIANDAPVVLFAGKYEPKKCPLELLSAFASLEHPTAVLVFVGSGPLESEISRRAAELPAGRVVLHGFQNQSAMPRIYALADLVVLPSIGAAETWGLCINEAMNLAKPVIVSSHVGCGPDLVIPGKTGWICSAGDLPSLRFALTEALADIHRLKAMGLNAQARIQKYSYVAATSGLKRALSAVLSCK